MPAYVIMHTHKAEECGQAFGAIAKAKAEAGVEVMDNVLICTCPSGEHRGIIVAEVDSRELLDTFAANIGLGETTVNVADRMQSPDQILLSPSQKR